MTGDALAGRVDMPDAAKPPSRMYGRELFRDTNSFQRNGLPHHANLANALLQVVLLRTGLNLGD